MCNCIISQYPDETAEIERLAATPDDEIAQQAIADLAQVVPGAERASDFLRDTKVTRSPVGEIELSPEYYTELLPHIPEPLGSIHFTGDYTHPMSFVDGAVLSGVTTARTLGSDLVTADDDRAWKLSTRLSRRWCPPVDDRIAPTRSNSYWTDSRGSAHVSDSENRG